MSYLDNPRVLIKGLNGMRGSHIKTLTKENNLGYTKEYIESIWLMPRQELVADFVVATGEGATVREFCDAAFSCIGLNWEEFVETDSKYRHPTKVDTLIGGAAKAKRYLGWEAKTFWKPPAELMVQFDFKQI